MPGVAPAKHRPDYASLSIVKLSLKAILTAEPGGQTGMRHETFISPRGKKCEWVRK